MLDMICVWLWIIVALVNGIAALSVSATVGPEAAVPFVIVMLVSVVLVMQYRICLEIRKDKEP